MSFWYIYTVELR